MSDSDSHASKAQDIPPGVVSVQVGFPQDGDEHYRYSSEWVANKMRGIARTLHSSATVIDELESMLAGHIDMALFNGSHVEPLLILLRDRLRSARLSDAPHASLIPQILSEQERSRSEYDRIIEVCQFGVHALGEIGTPCWTSQSVIAALGSFITYKVYDLAVQDVLRGLLADLTRERRKASAKFVRMAFVESFVAQCQTIFDQYIVWSAPLAIDSFEISDWVCRIERDVVIGRGPGYSLTFRRQVQDAVSQYRKTHKEQVPYTVHPGLMECIERIVFARSPYVVEDEKKKVDQALDRLVREHGFCSDCAAELFKEFAPYRWPKQGE